MQIVFAIEDAAIDVDVTLAADATVAELAQALGEGSLPEGTGVFADGRFVAGATFVRDAGIRDGACVELSRPDQAPPSGSPRVDLRAVGGLLAGFRTTLPSGSYVIGRTDGDIRLESPTVSARHARVTVEDDGTVTIEDLGSTNGTRVGDAFVTGVTHVASGAPIHLGAVQLVCGPARHSDVSAVPRPPQGGGTLPFNRPPRGPAPTGPTPLRAPDGPAEPRAASRFGWAALCAPIAAGVAMAYLFDPRMAFFAFFSPVMMLGNWVEDRRRVKRERRAGGARFARRLAEFQAALSGARVAERARRVLAYPDTAECARRAAAPSTRLWERRPGHDDFMNLRLGTGSVPWRPPVVEGRGALAPEIEAAIAAAAPISDAPVGVSLGKGRCLGVVGGRGATVALLRSLICQAAVHHGPADLRIAVLTEPDRTRDWDWVKWLPHTRSAAEGSGRRLLASTADEIDAVVSDLGGAAHGDAAPALVLLVVDADGLTEGRTAPARDLLGGAGPPVAGIVTAAMNDRLPAVCTTVVELDGDDGAARVTEPAVGVTVDDLLAAGTRPATARECARALAGFEDPEVPSAGGNLPDGVPLLYLLDMETPSADDVLARWRSRDRNPSLGAPIGVTEHGPLVLDLVGDGPHGLVAGTTGSGKSELLRTFVASLAASTSPRDLNFVLIDYKGGSAFDACSRLPHTVGLVTDLDEHLGQRALRCLEAELRYRERRLREAGVSDLSDLRITGSTAPLPRLLVVVDEFAAMAAELPTFIDALVDVAQRGRSLGVHLVLATQRPTGVVNDHIRANTNLRIALRVQDSGDSADVIGAPSAAAIRRQNAGRGFVRLGPSEIVPFQAALVTGRTVGHARGGVEIERFRFGPRGAAGAPSAASAPSDCTDGPSDLELLVAAVGDAAERDAVPPARRPWPEPLPSEVTLDDVIPHVGTTRSGCVTPIGVIDEPDEQRQRPFSWDARRGNLLLYGVPGSGTSTALTTLAISIARTWPVADVHMYVLDFGSQSLAPLAELPHVGAYIGAGQRERQERLIRHLRGELDRRRRLVATGDGDLHGVPRIVLLLDNYGGFVSAFDDLAGAAFIDQMVRVVADGPALGVYVVATADRINAVPHSVSTLVAEKLAFRLSDRYDYTAFGFAVAQVPKLGPGRCLDVETRREVQIALPGPCGLALAVDGCRDALADPATLPAPIGVLPEVVSRDAVLGKTTVEGDEWVMPVGLGDRSLTPTGLRLSPGDHALIVGPSRSGKTTTLAAFAAVAASTKAVRVTAIAMRRTALRLAPGVDVVVDHEDDLDAVIDAVADAEGPQLVLVDDAEFVDDRHGALARLLARRRADVHVLAAGRADALRTSYGHWTAELRRSRQGIALRPADMDGDLWQAMLPRHRPASWPPGRGYLVAEGEIELMQVAS